MNSTTLRGIFPEPKPTHRKNFMKENIKMLKQMQEQHNLAKKQSEQEKLLPKRVLSNPQVLNIQSRYRNVSKKYISNTAVLQQQVKSDRSERSNNDKLESSTSAAAATTTRSKRSKSAEGRTKSYDKGVQTDRQDISKSPQKVNQSILQQKKTMLRGGVGGRGDARPEDFMTKNNKPVPAEFTNLQTLNKKTPTSESPYTQKLPIKYGRSRKQEEKPPAEPQKANLVLLPDEERKEYLRVARENYAGLIKELNSMPVRNDTLKKRNRKIEIEVELQRLDEVIKIFQKPKVFVKADA